LKEAEEKGIVIMEEEEYKEYKTFKEAKEKGVVVMVGRTEYEEMRVDTKTKNMSGIDNRRKK
jgi:hypothetical protein